MRMNKSKKCTVDNFYYTIGECVSGALYWKQLFDLAQEIGFEIPRTVSISTFDIVKPDLKKVVGKFNVFFV